ncbi:hypothetical protein MXD62_36320 [Frankia sp. Mgl5]|uniref:hypothetical protein n=1 Tax=Frankia sp. Mgl5 TaxID=2933793 RepID=UPI00200D5183|nr:hypothetical protein [Frankia sp. Mgl5]MCK9932546.1 hypothetical protein [Frankia sp. Mgl5]
MVSPAERAASVIRSNRYLTMATAEAHHPWAAPLAYVLLPDASLVFYSARSAKHVRAGLISGEVAGALFNSTLPSDDVDGVQFLGSLFEVADSELALVMPAYFEGSFPDPEVRARWNRPESDFYKESPQGFYKIILTEVFVPDPTSTQIDLRQSVEINQLKVLLIA